MKYAYTENELKEAVASNFSYAAVLKQLGIKHSGGMQSYIKSKITKLKYDTSHFTGQGWNRGKISNNKLSPSEILIKSDSFYRTKASQLKRALIEIGVEYKCYECKNDKWRGKPLNLEIHHVDGDNRNNIKENLQFLCPNCHSQTDNYGMK